MFSQSKDQFAAFVEAEFARTGAKRAVAPLVVRLLSDQLTPVLAYRRLVAPDERTATSFLLESVEGGERQGRHSMLGARPAIEFVARGHAVRIRRRDEPEGQAFQADDPLDELRRCTSDLAFFKPPEVALPGAMIGGWAGFASYDTVRYAESEKLNTDEAPPDDRHLPDLHFGFYDQLAVFDHAEKVVNAIRLIEVTPDLDVRAAYDAGAAELQKFVDELQTHSKPLRSGVVTAPDSSVVMDSNLTQEQHAAMVARAQEYIRAGDIFQVVLGQRFEKRSEVDPFDVYRALRAVNPSPYMVYMQGEGCILVASSPEILCRVRRDRERDTLSVTNRPLAGTRKRGADAEEDAALERELLADEKERAEHIMLVDLGRNDVGQVAQPASVELTSIMDVERYSHVMHISSTVKGELRPGKDCWDALRATLPVGTISGAPKIRAMQIIDELEPVRRGPYGGGMGYASVDGEMDIALALRTIVVPTALFDGRLWTYHIQAAGGIVADSDPEAEFQETVNKAAALARAIELAESAFMSGSGVSFEADGA